MIVWLIASLGGCRTPRLLAQDRLPRQPVVVACWGGGTRVKRGVFEECSGEGDQKVSASAGERTGVHSRPRKSATLSSYDI